MTTAEHASHVETALRTVAVNGSYHASRALSKWLRRGVHLTSEGFRAVPIHEVSTIAGEADEPLAAIHLPLAGDIGGHMLLTFPSRVAMLLADVMMQQPEGTCTELGEIEQSCLQETGNIVCSAYANSLAKWLLLHIEPSVPTFAYDMASSIIDPFVVEFAADHDEVLVVKTDFHMDGQRQEWNLLLLPSREGMRLIEGACDSSTARSAALHTIAINGSFDASKAMSKWLKRGVRLATEGFERLSLRSIDTMFENPDEPIVALHLPLQGQVTGHTLLAMSEESGLRLADMLMGQPIGTSTELGELETSCLAETGNIVSSAFVNSWSRWLDVHVEPASPEFVRDLPAAVVASVVPEQARVSDEIFLARTSFLLGDERLEWVYLLLPSPSAMRLIETICA